jgi:hypothetical protein
MRTTCLVALLAFAALLAAGCGSDSAGDGGTAHTPTAQSSASGSESYRSAVNELFQTILAARGAYNAAHGEAALHASAVTLAKADEGALTRLKALRVPSSAKELQAQLVQSLEAQHAKVKALLAAAKIDTAKLGDAVLMSNDTERLVNQINTLP